jgi:FAD/FMN-containing dehydrogenase
MENVNSIGFDLSSRSWVTNTSGNPVVRLPELDGSLRVDDAALNAAADDFGHIRHLRPLAVLEPSSIADIMNIVEFAREHGIKVAAQGRGHTTFGQAQVEGGILIKMSALDLPPLFEDQTVQVSAGTNWLKVVATTLRQGLRPPVLTHSLELSVGGTLSVAGIDGGSYRYGAQIDNVIELQVVTGEGCLETCSEVRQPELFNAMLAGMGQCGIIVRAKLRLIPAESHARIFRLHYPDLPTMLHDQRLLINEGRFDRVQGRIVPIPWGTWTYLLLCAKNYTPPAIPDNAQLLEGLSFILKSLQVRDSSYFRHVDRTFQFAAAIAAGKYAPPQPWFHCIVPDSVSDPFLPEVLDQLAPGEIGDDLPIEVIALKRDALTRPLFRIPDESIVYVFGCLLRAPDSRAANQTIERNRRFFERARELGCKHSTISAVQLTPQEWREHYHPFWEQFSNAKKYYDPSNILTPGPGIFA